MERFTATPRSKPGVLMESSTTAAKPTPSSSSSRMINDSAEMIVNSGGTVVVDRHSRGFYAADDDNYPEHASADEIVDEEQEFVVSTSTTTTASLESKRRLNQIIWPVYELCNAESSVLHKYIQSLITFPRLIVVAADQSMLNVVNDLAAMEAAGKGDGRFQFYYVSAGPRGGGYYLSTLLFRHSLFESEPIIPVAFMLHERKSANDHRRLFELIQEKCPDVASTECVFVTDREFGDIKSVLPNSLQFISWHYFEDDILNWVENTNGTNDEANTYIHDTFQLMKSKTLMQFNRDLAVKRRQWPSDFVRFFDECLRQDIVSKGGRWHAESSGRQGTYDPFCGISIPTCDDLNQLFRELLEWNDITLDQLLLCTFYFTEYYVRENEMSMHQTGVYKFKSRFVRACRPIRRMRVFAPSEVNDPKEVVSYVRTCSLVSR